MARIQAGDSNIGWLLRASEKSLRQGHSWQGKPVSSKSSRGLDVTAFPCRGATFFLHQMHAFGDAPPRTCSHFAASGM